MKDQRFWTDYKSHNMKWNPTITEGDVDVERLQTDFVVKNSFIDELSATAPKIEEPPPPPPTPPIKPQVLPKQVAKDPLDGIPKCFIYCLPATMSQKRDNLYDEEYISIKYGEPYSLGGVILEEHDLCINFWTTADIPKESVIFPKNTQKRWWKIIGHEVRHGGKVYVCAPSTYQPHFENT